jgi:multidrug efflux pump subunit AcrA (membrane-fusion protein)
MHNLRNNLLVILTTGIALSPATPLLAHEGEQHGTPPPTAASSSGPVRLSEQAKKTLDLKVEEVNLYTIEMFVKCFGIVEAVPDKVHFISIRTSGRITKVLVNQGDTVKKGDLLAEVESRQIGDPPPIIPVTATLTGIITERHVFKGEPVEPDKVLFKIADLSKVRVKCHVYEADIGKVTLGQKVRVYFEAYPRKPFEGTVEFLGGELEEETRSLPVWCRLENRGLALRPNMRAEVYIITAEIKETIAVPINAILGEAGNVFVFVENGDVYEKKTVVIGKRDDRYIEIVEGLLPGDIVVTQGNYQLQFATSSSTPAPKPEASSPKAKGKK